VVFCLRSRTGSGPNLVVGRAGSNSCMVCEQVMPPRYRPTRFHPPGAAFPQCGFPCLTRRSCEAVVRFEVVPGVMGLRDDRERTTAANNRRRKHRAVLALLVAPHRGAPRAEGASGASGGVRAPRMHTSASDGLGSTVPQRGARANAHHPLPVGGGRAGELFLHRVRVGHPSTEPRPGRTSRNAAEVRSRFSLGGARQRVRPWMH
jgi:hypothetical protein